MMIRLAPWLAVALAMAAPAHAQTARCADRTAIVAGLLAEYGEVQVMAGQQGTDTILEVFANPATGSWTVLTTTRDGMACLRGAGTDLVIARPDDPA